MTQQRTIHNILVTGGAGFIGSAFIRYLLQSTPFKGLCVNYDSLTYAGNLDNLREVHHDPRYRFHKGDIRNEALLDQIIAEHQIDTIIHFAAESHVDRSILGPKAFIETNVMGTFQLLEAVRKHPLIHFHHVSTDEVYGCLGETGFFVEETPYKPNSPYSASKAASDHLVRSYVATYGISACISNCSNNYGPYHFPEKLIPLMILNCLDHKPLPVYGKGQNVRDWLYVEDHAEALWKLLNQGKRGETYNIGGEAEWANIDLIHEIIAILAQEISFPKETLQELITFVSDRPGHDFRYAIDCSKIKKEIGWTPTHSFSEGIRKTISWYLNNSEWVRDVRSGSYQQWVATNYNSREHLKQNSATSQLVYQS